jgi:hypothetical protein
MRIVLVAALLLAACDRPPPEPPSIDTRPAPVLATPPLRLTLQAPAEVRPGGVVPIRLAVRNAGTGPLTLEMGDSASSFDFVVTGPDGRELWSRMHSVQAIPLVLHERELSPGREIVFTDEWDLRDTRGRAVPLGSYTLHALLDADTMPYRMLKTPPQTLVVTPR